MNKGKKGSALLNMGSIVVFALLYSSQVEAVKLRDIFDAYDEESKKEAMDAND